MDPKLLSQLEQIANVPHVVSAIEDSILRIEKELSNHPDQLFGWEVLPLSLFAQLPSTIRSAWIFLIRSGLASEKHRHPNSRQITMSYRGAGDLQTWENNQWRSNALVSNIQAPREQRWVDIPAGTWHRPAVHDDWVVLSFHTAGETELIEESGEEISKGELQTRKYR